MKERPILFQGAMVRALLAGTKTQTRRIVKECQIAGGPPMQSLLAECPYGHAGNRLWVKETWTTKRPDLRKCTPRLLPRGLALSYAADTRREDTRAIYGPWQSPLFMMRHMSRLTLDVVAVRVERLQDISPADCLAEGISKELMREILVAANRCKTEPEYWIRGHDEGLSYCHACATKEVAELLKKEPGADYRLGGGGGNEGDSTPFCESCEKRLDTSLTEYGALEELKHFGDYGIDLKSPDDCQSFLDALDGMIWPPGDHFPGEQQYKKDRRNQGQELMHRLCYRVLWDSINAKPKPVLGEGGKVSHYVSYPWGGDAGTRRHRGKPWHVIPNPWVWVVEFRRGQA